MKKFQVKLSSLSPLMFNTFRGQEEIPPERKLNLSSKDGRTVVLPASNIMGFLASKMVGRSCINTFVPPKERPERQAEVLASIAISPVEIPIQNGGGPVTFDGTWSDTVYMDERAAQASKTARVMARRPVIREPWSVEFTLIVSEGDYITADRIRDWFVDGGVQVGIGAFRPFFGRFAVEAWDEIG